MKSSGIRFLLGMAMAVLTNPNLTAQEKSNHLNSYNKQAEGLLFSGSPQPRNPISQKKKRKFASQDRRNKFAKNLKRK